MRFLVTAGPTREPIDPVRFISNRSSGRMGFAVAAAAHRRKHDVVLISGPTSLADPAGVRAVRVVTAREMTAAVHKHFADCDVLVMAAAVADWRPVRPSPQKLKKRDGLDTLRLERTEDILAGIGPEKGDRIVVGFAAETGDLRREATQKLVDKGLDLVVANDVAQPDSGFEVETNRAVLIGADGEVEDLPLMSKRDLAGRIVSWVETRLNR